MTYFNMKWSMRALSVLPSRSRGQTPVYALRQIREERNAEKNIDIQEVDGFKLSERINYPTKQNPSK